MALPTLVKSYTTTYLNQTQTATGLAATTAAKVLFAIVTAMKALGWTEISSCDSVTVGTGKWVTYSNLVWAYGSAHSWIVLKQTGANGAQICFDLNFAPANPQMYFYFSPSAGFTGGSTTAHPTATDIQQIGSSPMNWFPSIDSNVIWHLLESTDGALTRLFVISGNTCYFFMGMDVPVIPSDLTWTPLNTCVAVSGAPNLANLYNTANTFGRIGSTPVNVGLYWTCESFNGNPLPSYQNNSDDNTLDWPLWPIGLYCITAGTRGHKGNLTDIWWGASNNTIGSSYPQAGASGNPYQFAQFGGLVIPWNVNGGTAAPITVV